MSNQITLTATEFNSKNGETTYGFRMYDDAYAAYVNTLTKEEAFGPDLQLLFLATEADDPDVRMMLDFATNEGILINNNFYDGDQVREIIELI